MIPSATATPPVPPTFRERSVQAMETHTGLDLVALMALWHDEAIAEVTERAVEARNAVARVSVAAAVDSQMMASVLSVVAPMLRISGENAARSEHFAGVVRNVRTLLAEADGAGTQVDAEQLRQLLDTSAAPAAFRPTTLGFVPSTQYRVGAFRHVHAAGEWHLPFAGFSLCSEAPDRGMTTHLAFLHKGVARPRPVLYAEYGLVMELLE